MRKKMFMICLIVILVVCAALVICGCGARQAMPQDGMTDGDVVTASGDGDNVTDANAGDSQSGKEELDTSDEPEETEKPVEKPAKEPENMIIDRIALILAVIGGLNWGLVGLFRFDLVAYLFGGQTATVSRIVYTLVGIAAVWCISLLFRERDTTEEA